jgi:hypothetical protein
VQAELSIVAAFLCYGVWDKFHSDVSTQDMPEDLQPIYRTLDSWHKTQNEEQADLHVQDLAALFFAQNKTNKEFYGKVFDTLGSYTPNVSVVKELIQSVRRATLLRELSLASYDVAEGKKSYEDVQKLMEALDAADEEPEDDSDAFVTDDLNSLLDTTYKTPGLRWRLNVLNKSLGSLRKGDFGFIFARPETGKTTFLASEVTHMAEQATGPVLWINNEEQNPKVKSRVYQAALGVTLAEMLSNTEYWDKEYKKKLGGKILIPNQSVYTRWDVEKLCKRYKPSLVVVDQLPKIKGFKAERDDLMLGAIFEWARDLAKQWCPVIGVSQAGATAEGKKYLTMDDVAKVKTEAQAEADFMLGIGKTHDTGWEEFRFLNISKNKLSGDVDSDPNLRHAKMEVKIDALRARYKDIK